VNRNPIAPSRKPGLYRFNVAGLITLILKWRWKIQDNDIGAQDIDIGAGVPLRCRLFLGSYDGHNCCF
jgi:hypothetical protein